MPLFLGIDTSNYTTSVAVYDSEKGGVIQEKMLLPVKEGQLGLRQSDAVFHHTVQLPKVIGRLFERLGKSDICAVGVSVRPRNVSGSYMPCFLCGEGLADSIGSIGNIPVYKTSHQTGHILAALYSADRLSLLKEEFAAFHISGGTTDCLLCRYDDEDILNISETGTSLDLKGGQLIDRTGLMLGLKFPCGKELEALAVKSSADVKKMNIRPVMKNGSCCLSGFENRFRKMLDDDVPPCDIALGCQYAIAVTADAMTEHSVKLYGELPVIYAGGVMSNRYIRSYITKKRERAYFAEPEFSCDNAAGTAIAAALKHGALS
ncbi:MAG: peptidase M22 [Oscillospiraceae bacterium]|nr:peptidase M22 [Oscillospiraceae bacterium]MBQ8826287.1 peptidase M22 [Oscillospiraceae bacterium]